MITSTRSSGSGRLSRSARLVLEPENIQAGLVAGQNLLVSKLAPTAFRIFNFVPIFPSTATDDDADRLLVDEEHVIGRADIGLPFAHRDTGIGSEIDLVLGLHRPAGGAQLGVDAVAGLLFGVLVFGHRTGDAWRAGIAQ